MICRKEKKGRTGKNVGNDQVEVIKTFFLRKKGKSPDVSARQVCCMICLESPLIYIVLAWRAL